MTLPGVDLASFQGQPATWQAHAGAIDWAAVKLTEYQPGGARYVNPDAAADWAWLGAHHLGRIAYLYARPSVLPSETVGLFASALEPMGLQPGDGIAVDLEETDGLPPAQVAAWGRAVCAALRATFGRPPVVYTYLDFALAGNCAGLGGYPLWISDPSSQAGHPRVPAPWTSWAAHQFEVTGAIDRDVAAWPSLAAMSAAIGKPTPVLPEDSMMLSKGAGAITPYAVPANCARVRLYCAGDATIGWKLVDAPETQIRLTPAASWVFALPAGHHAVRLTRLDDGTADVCAVSEP